MVHRCKQCLLPASVPGADLDHAGVCAPCRSYVPGADHASETQRTQRKADLDAALRDCRGKGRYDALVCLSGGKDSLYLLHRAKVDYGLNVLAFTTDANIPDVAWSNIRRQSRSSVSIISFTGRRKSFYREALPVLLRNQEERGAVYTVSYVYAPLFEGTRWRLPPSGGFRSCSPATRPASRSPNAWSTSSGLELISQTDWTPPASAGFGRFRRRRLCALLEPAPLTRGTRFPRYLAPFHAWDYDQNAVMKAVARARPRVATGAREPYREQLSGRTGCSCIRTCATLATTPTFPSSRR